MHHFQERHQTVFCVIMRLSLLSSKESIIKQLVDLVFVISEIIKVSLADNIHLSSDYSGYHQNLIQ